MAVNVTELQKRIHAIVAQDADGPTEGGDDWDLYLKYINMAQQEWQEAYQWPSLYKEVNTLTSQATGNVTVSLPADFRKFDASPIICDGTNTKHTYPQVSPEMRGQYNDTEQYFYVLGYPGSYNMVVNPGTHGSGASIYYSYWSTAASLVSGDNVSMCPDPNYLSQRTVAYVWEARDDGRFPQAKAEADKILARMLEFEQTKGYSYDDRIQTYEEARYGFRIGKDS